MSAIPQDFLRATAELSAAATRPFPNSRKLYLTGSRPDLRVPLREIAQQPTPTGFGIEANPPVPVYDSSGPYTDPVATIDLLTGLPSVRAGWIEERGDTERLTGPTSAYGRARADDPALASLRFEHLRIPRRAKSGANVTQMHYARRGVVTPEMEYIALRESLRLRELRDDLRYTKLLRQHRGQSFGAAIPNEVTPEFVRDEVARTLPPATSNRSVRTSANGSAAAWLRSVAWVSWSA